MHDDSQSRNRSIDFWKFGRYVERPHPAGFFETHATLPFHFKTGSSIGGRNFYCLDRLQGKIRSALREHHLLAGFPGNKYFPVDVGQCRLHLRDLLFQWAFLVGSQNGSSLNARSRIHTGVAIKSFVAQRVVEREHLIVFTLGDRIVFVIVALSTAQRQSKDRFAKCLHSIRVVIGEVFLGDGSSLMGHHVVALKAGRDEL